MLIRLIYLALQKYQYEEASKENYYFLGWNFTPPFRSPIFRNFHFAASSGSKQINVTARNQSQNQALHLYHVQNLYAFVVVYLNSLRLCQEDDKINPDKERISKKSPFICVLEYLDPPPNPTPHHFMFLGIGHFTVMGFIINDFVLVITKLHLKVS